MKYINIIILIVLLLNMTLQAQIQQGGSPESFSYPDSLTHVNTYNIQPPNIEQLLMQDMEEMLDKGRMRIGVLLQANLNPQNSGVWDILNNGDKIWRLSVASKGAKALNVYFDDFNLPSGAKLFIYNSDKTDIVGALTEFNNDESRLMATRAIQGEQITFELILPANVAETPALHISEIGYIYNYKKHDSDKGADYCLVNVNCPEGNNWQEQKRGVVKMNMRVGNSIFLCTGSVVNNTKNDCTPYVLTAYHCGKDASASDLNQWVFYFNYEANECGGANGPANQTMTGCVFRSKGIWNGSFTSPSSSDFYLVRLKQSIPSHFFPYYNGWSRSLNTNTTGVCIHHPQGDIKKISTFNTDLSGSLFFWNVKWASTVTHHSVTEGGSSGAPLFNAHKQIIGTLTGGTSYCHAPNNTDYFGKFERHWSGTGTTNDAKLSPWLDPINTFANSLNGLSYTACHDVSVNELAQKTFQMTIFPNPVNETLHIELEELSIDKFDVKIFNTMGQLLLQQINFDKKITVNVKNLSEGLYYLVVKTPTLTNSQSFVIVK